MEGFIVSALKFIVSFVSFREFFTYSSLITFIPKLYYRHMFQVVVARENVATATERCHEFFGL
jgi:hypothetical protein